MNTNRAALVQTLGFHRVSKYAQFGRDAPPPGTALDEALERDEALEGDGDRELHSAPLQERHQRLAEERAVQPHLELHPGQGSLGRRQAAAHEGLGVPRVMNIARAMGEIQDLAESERGDRWIWRRF
jgi:hypothetical protein